MAVTPEMIAVALGVNAPASDSPQFAQWSMWIDDARLLIEARLGDLTLLDQAKLDYVVREAVVLQARRPDGATQVTTSVDDGSLSRTYQASRGRVAILDEWWDLLSPARPRGKAFEVDTMPATAGAVGTYGTDYVWVSTTETGPVP
jgi:hypothetical protein